MTSADLDLLTTPEAAAVLGIRPRTMYKLVHEGKISRIGGGAEDNLYRRADVEALRDQREQARPKSAEPTPCGCGCGQALGADDLAAHRSFLPGHSPRKAMILVQCDGCGDTKKILAQRRKTWAACSHECASIVNYRGLADKALHGRALKQRLVDFMRSERLTVKALSAAVELHPDVIRQWFRIDGRVLSSQAITGVAAMLGLECDQVLNEAGGVTVEDGRRQRALTLVETAEQRSAEERSLIGRKGGLAHITRQRLLPKEKREDRRTVGRKAAATAAASGKQGNSLAAMQAVNESPAGRLRASLISWLNFTPHPTPDQVRARARSVGQRLGLSEQAVLSEWRPYLQERGLQGKGGRPPKQKRCQVIAAELKRLPTERQQRVPKGFYPRVAALISAAEKLDPPIDAMSVKAWRVRHKPHPDCPLTSVLTRTATRPIIGDETG